MYVFQSSPFALQKFNNLLPNPNLLPFDVCSGRCVAAVAGHAELVTALRFTPDGKRLISAGGDGYVSPPPFIDMICTNFDLDEKVSVALLLLFDCLNTFH